MNRQDAIKELVKVGKVGEVKSLLSRHAEMAQAAYERIRTDPKMSDAYMKKSLAHQQMQTQRQVDAELDEAARRVVRIDNDDAAAVFGVKGISGDTASLSISRRDAGDRVAKINDGQELTALLRRATRTGDEVLARAIAERATELQNAEVMHQFLGDRPALDGAGERLWNVERAERTWDVGVAAQLGALRASELSGMHNDDIEALANNDPQPASKKAEPIDTQGATASAPNMESAYT